MSVGHCDLLRVFGRSAPVQVPRNDINKENEEYVNYKVSNKSLVMKNAALKMEIAQLKRKIVEQREEINAKEEKIARLESSSDQEKIDYLVAEKFKKKFKHLKTITERTIMGLSKAAEDFKDVMCDLSSNTEYEESVQLLSMPIKAPTLGRAKPTSSISLDRIPESPLVKNKVRNSKSLVSPSTPNNSHITTRRTPRNLPKNTPRGRPRSTPSRITETDTARQKRAAASKIISMAEPRLNVKLRQPGKYDEPSPYISTSFM